MAGIILMAAEVLAHTPLCSCYENGDGTITCEGGFSDGSSASGVMIKVTDKKGNILIKDKMDEYSEFTFDIPSSPYKVIFDAGPGHEVEIPDTQITE
jgi:hypothetical protein